VKTDLDYFDRFDTNTTYDCWVNHKDAKIVSLDPPQEDSGIPSWILLIIIVAFISLVLIMLIALAMVVIFGGGVCCIILKYGSASGKAVHVPDITRSLDEEESRSKKEWRKSEGRKFGTKSGDIPEGYSPLAGQFPGEEEEIPSYRSGVNLAGGTHFGEPVYGTAYAVYAQPNLQTGRQG